VPMIEAADAMHLVKDIPAEDQRVIQMMANMHKVQLLDSKGRVDYEKLRDLIEQAYRKGRETEAQRHRLFMVGSLADAEKICIVRAMEYCGHNIAAATKMLDIGKTTMYRKLRLYKLYGRNGDES
jgi:transcriptional regulator of acetoin/glycerol metabolism